LGKLNGRERFRHRWKIVVINAQFPERVRNFLPSKVIVSFSRRPLPNGFYGDQVKNGSVIHSDSCGICGMSFYRDVHTDL
jgi:hypothetical protein